MFYTIPGPLVTTWNPVHSLLSPSWLPSFQLGSPTSRIPRFKFWVQMRYFTSSSHPPFFSYTTKRPISLERFRGNLFRHPKEESILRFAPGRRQPPSFFFLFFWGIVCFTSGLLLFGSIKIVDRVLLRRTSDIGLGITTNRVTTRVCIPVYSQ